MENKIEVLINGEIIPLRSNEDEEYLQKLARYVDKKISELSILNPAASLQERKRTLFIAINIADDYFKTLEKLELLESEQENHILEMERMLDEKKLLNSRIQRLQGELVRNQAEVQELQEELKQKQNELNEFIAAFDEQKAGEGDNIVAFSQSERKVW